MRIDEIAKHRVGRASSLLSSIGKGIGRVVWHTSWEVGILRRPIASLLKDPSVADAEFILSGASGGFVADPFGYWTGDTLRILYEEFHGESGRRVVAACNWSPGYGVTDGESDVLGLACQQSYPYIFGANGRIYCVPETAEARAVWLFESSRGDGNWACIGQLIAEARLVDCTVVQRDGYWWLFCSDRSLSGPNLCVWHAEELLGPWVPHVANPVKLDPATSRPAGTPFEAEGWLYRPAQDCSSGYGKRVVLNRITKLDLDGFEEVVEQVVEPPPGKRRHGLHTVAAVGEFTLLDAQARRMSMRGTLRKVLRKKWRGLL